MRAQLYSIDSLPSGLVSVMARPRGGDWLLDEMKALREAGVDILVSFLTPDEIGELDLVTEPEDCRHEGMLYFNLPVPDRSIPPFTDQTFVFLAQLNAHLSEGKHIVFHCRQGVGRAVLGAASLLILNGCTPQQAFERLSQARGYSVPETEEQRAWVIAFSQQYG